MKIYVLYTYKYSFKHLNLLVLNLEMKLMNKDVNILDKDYKN